MKTENSLSTKKTRLFMPSQILNSSMPTKEAHLTPKISRMFITWSQSVTSHCYPKIFKPQTQLVSKFVWSCVFLLFTGLTSAILVNNVLAYYAYSVVSTIVVVNERSSVTRSRMMCKCPFWTTRTRASMNCSRIASSSSSMRLSLSMALICPR